MAKQPTGDGLRLRKRELFASLGYVPHEGQIAVHRSKALRRVLACGVRWGKTTCGAMEGVAALLEPRERSIGWIVGPTLDLSERILRVIVETFEARFAHRIRSWEPREGRLVVRNLAGGLSEVCAMSAETPSSLLGEGLDWVIVDEAARLKRDIWQQHVSQRLVDKRGWALLLSTPRGPGWFFQLYKRGQNGRDPQFESWSSPSWTNPHLSRDVIEEERKRLPDTVFAQEYEARFLGGEKSPCETCGWPSPTARCVVVVEKGDAVIPKCPECGRSVDDYGKTIMGCGRNGESYLTVIRGPRLKSPIDHQPTLNQAT